MPVTLATWEVEIRSVMIEGQPGGKRFVRPYLNGKKPEWQHLPAIPAKTRNVKQED
jgi:hypothetical protein